MYPRWFPHLAALTIGAAPAFAQTRQLDEGTLVLTRGGAVVGTESFRVVSAAMGDRTDLIKLTGHVPAADQQTSSTLVSDSIGTPLTYSLVVKAGATTVLDLKANAAPRRLTSMAKDQRGNESMREYLVSPGATIVLDEGLYHEFAVLALRRGNGSVKVISPRSGKESVETISPGGLEAIDVGGHSVTATKYTIGSGATRREFWVDSAGRLLRVADPARGVIATRDELPR
jgi:hypothetical protein